MLLMAVFLSLVVLWIGCANFPDFPAFPAPTTEKSSTRPAPAEPSAKPSLPEPDIIELYSPDWFRSVPEEPGYIYAVAEDQNRDRSLATINAKVKAHARISKQVEERYRAFLAEAGVDPGESVSRMMAVGVQTVKIEDVKEETIFYAYVLMRISEKNVKASIVTMIEADENLHAKLKESPKFIELMEETKVEDAEKREP